MGYDYGYMLANEIVYVYNALFHSLLPNPVEDELLIPLINEILDDQVCLLASYTSLNSL